MRVFMTGATGFAGSHLADILLAQGSQVSALVHRGSGHQPVPNHRNFKSTPGDLLDLPSLIKTVSEEKPDVIFHLAGLASPSASWNDPLKTILVNCGGTANILEAARLSKSPKVIVVTSGLIYDKLKPEELPITEELEPRPAHPYGVSKMASGQLTRLYWQKYNLRAIEARPLNHIGPRQSLGFVVPDFARQISRIKLGKSDLKVSVGDLSAMRDFTDVRDVAMAYISLAESGRAGECYLICSGEAVSINHVLTEMIALAGVEVKIERDPKKMRPLETEKLYGSFEKLNRHTGWKPKIPLQQSLADSLDEWLKNEE